MPVGLQEGREGRGDVRLEERGEVGERGEGRVGEGGGDCGGRGGAGGEEGGEEEADGEGEVGGKVVLIFGRGVLVRVGWGVGWGGADLGGGPLLCCRVCELRGGRLVG